MVSEQLRNDLEDAANRMRVSSIEMTVASKSGHPSSSTSAGLFIFFQLVSIVKVHKQNVR